MLDASDISGTDALLYVAELLHRVKNEYAKMIALASVLASRSLSEETKVALEKVIECLTRSAKIHQLLSPPTFDGVTDLGDYLTQLCKFKAAAELDRRAISLHLAIPSLMVLENTRCWRVGLIIAELITNAERHGESCGPAAIFVSVGLEVNQVVCRVSNDGSTTSKCTPHQGTLLVDALAAEIEGRIERRFGENGATITLSFPAEIDQSPERQKLSYFREVQ
jgi:two-component sensor histidine kinase